MHGLMLSLLLATADPYGGVWRSVGYGQVLEVGAEAVNLYAEAAGRITRFAHGQRDGGRFVLRFAPNEAATFLMAVAGPRMVATVTATGQQTLYQRMPALPEREAEAAGAQRLYDIVWQTFADHYAFFDERAVDWDALRLRYRPDKPDIDEGALFDRLSGLLSHLGNDHHVRLSGAGRRFSPGSPTTNSHYPGRGDLDRFVSRSHLGSAAEETANGMIRYARIDEGRIGYLLVRRFQDYVNTGSIADQSKVLSGSLDEIAAAMADTSAIIVDVRSNGGGFDAFALAVAGLFADAPYVAFSEEARIGGTDRFTEPRVHLVTPRTLNLADKAVAILTGPRTASAAEVFLLAMMGNPRATRIGEPTAGVFSDVLFRQLPNGWHFTLSNERYYGPGGESFEGRGLLPDRTIPFATTDMEARSDPVVANALELLTGRHTLHGDQP